MTSVNTKDLIFVCIIFVIDNLMIYIFHVRSAWVPWQIRPRTMYIYIYVECKPFI